LALRPSSAPIASFPRGVKTEILPAGSRILRIHHEDNGAIWFGPSPGKPAAYRFDAIGGEYRIMYAAAAIDGAFAETILHGKTVSQILSQAFVEQRAWTELTLQRPVTLMKLYDDGLFWHRTDAWISASDDYSAPRKLALDAFRQCPALDGLTYRSRHNNGELCYALFDRVAKADLSEGPKHFLRDHRADVAGLMAKYGAVYDASPPVPPARR
jgi:RES domain